MQSLLVAVVRVLLRQLAAWVVVVLVVTLMVGLGQQIQSQ
jgi:hypothetical protein